MLPRLLLDTHILIRWVTEPKKVSKEQLRALENSVRRTELAAISAISLLETAVLASQGRRRLKMSLNEFFEELQGNPVFRVLRVTYEVAAEAASLSFLRDPADCAIVATARVHRLRLVTSEVRIIESKLVPVVA